MGQSFGRIVARLVLKLLQDFRGDADGDALGGFPYRVAHEMGMARGRLDLAVAEESGDHRQGFGEEERRGRNAVGGGQEAGRP